VNSGLGLDSGTSGKTLQMFEQLQEEALITANLERASLFDLLPSVCSIT
jgi:hypothetical protein